ncbi:MAG: methylated-DNA--[protein]-cysteine S-methyltransferase [Candidatus Thorarchaeota archaeon]|jgi:methylated-DNA-[protein]-cysteine S-methyltransferase
MHQALDGGIIITKVVAVLKHNKSYSAGVFTSDGVYATSLPRSSEKEAIASVYGEGLERSEKPEHLKVLTKVHSIFNGTPVQVEDILFDFSDLTENTIRVLESVRSIPRGETRTYGQVAMMSGLPKASRYIGTVMAANRYAPVIPCHRVVAANGLGGYSGGEGFGVATKKSLLMKEGAKIAKK